MNTKPRILVVDDQDIVRYTMDVVLTQQGYRVLEASSVPEAVEVLAAHHPDLVLLDLTMPGGDGIVLLRQMRQSALYKETPVIILTAHSDRNFVVEALKLGVRDYVIKVGFLIDDLLARVRQRLEESGVLPATPRASPVADGQSWKPPNPMDLGAFLEGLSGKSFPTVCARLSEASSSSLASLAEVEGLIRMDPVLAAKVMGRTQELLSRPRSLPKLGEALKMLGWIQLRDLLQAQERFDTSGALPEDSLRAWAHACFCSCWMERFCPEQPAAAMIGLLHDLPEILLMEKMPPEDWVALRESASSRSKTMAGAIEELFGIPYGEFVNAVFQRLQLPLAIADPILEYTNAYMSSSPIPATREAMKLSQANQWAHAFQLASTQGVAVHLPVREEIEPRLRVDDAAEMALISDDSWGLARSISEGLTVGASAWRFPMPLARPRLVLMRESWVSPHTPLEHLLGELGVLVTDPQESLQDYDWDAMVYLGDFPKRAFPAGFPYPKPLLVLHRLAKERCELPSAKRLEAMRMPSPLSRLTRMLASFE